MSKILNIIGYGGHSKVVIDVAKTSNYINFNFYVDDDVVVDIVDKASNNRNIFKIDSYESITNDTIIAIGNNLIRKKLSHSLNFSDFIILIHPSAIISDNVYIDFGTIIMAGVIIQPGTKIGKHCIINTGSCIDHDVIIHDFVHIAPNCSIAGGVIIEEGTFLGIGSVVINYISIGSWDIIGAGSVVIKNLISNITAVGNPAKIIKYHSI
jgi:sugar O-acyltransferase (sialic acid O-acetyltransferase NeuD family)